VEKLEPTYNADQNVKGCSHFRKQFDSFSKLNIEVPCNADILPPGIHTREMNTCTPMYMNVHSNIIIHLIKGREIPT
jgi:hypothetical protein